MPGVGGDRQHLLLLAIEREDVEAQLFIPEGLIEPFEQRSGLLSQLLGSVRLAKCIEYFGHTQPGVVDVTLQLAESLWSLYQRPVRINHAVSGILPAHVLVTDRRAGLVFLETIAVAVAVVVDPGQTSLGGIKMTFQQRLVAGRPPRGVKGDQIERRCIGRAVVRSVRNQLEMGEFPVAYLVQDL